MRTIHDPRYVQVIEHLKQRRRDLGLTQAQVTTRLGWHRTVLSNIETRERRLDVLELHDLCEVYGLLLAELVRGFGDRDSRRNRSPPGR